MHRLHVLWVYSASFRASESSAQEAIMPLCHISPSSMSMSKQIRPSPCCAYGRTYSRDCDGRGKRYIKTEPSASATARNMLRSGPGHISHALSLYPFLPLDSSSCGAALTATSTGRVASACAVAVVPPPLSLFSPQVRLTSKLQPVLPCNAATPAALAHMGWWIEENAT